MGGSSQSPILSREGVREINVIVSRNIVSLHRANDYAGMGEMEGADREAYVNIGQWNLP